MTIASVRIYYYARSEARTRRLTFSHWGFAEWFSRRLKPIREQLRGPEVHGVDIMNLMLYENPAQAWKPDQWYRRGNTVEFDFVCNLRPLLRSPAIENIPKLMSFYGQVCASAPWPQTQAVGRALEMPLSQLDQITLQPYLQWPRGERISEAKARHLAASAA
jgi:hypothetical protein